jgi:hypothetical protein
VYQVRRHADVKHVVVLITENIDVTWFTHSLPFRNNYAYSCPALSFLPHRVIAKA